MMGTSVKLLATFAIAKAGAETGPPASSYSSLDWRVNAFVEPERLISSNQAYVEMVNVVVAPVLATLSGSKTTQRNLPKS
jgi:hypothetical protein